ncbi:MAG: hypothetical protein KZQ88_00095 [Candidatus Thiodiazotropha sp. (ex Dulcina madagascariensis)]|nr:hypothetical protein [Candidatus Thiodiazotropha sp. (ex Dulcina madagascariensis)]MCU7926618.1 hypothetical protein [Candidatus Thiodiazotropha sp. (ex Dulcina madagascariensis)]
MRFSSFMTTVKLDPGSEGFSHRKWDGTQHCEEGAWLSSTRGDTYTAGEVSYEE